MSWRSMTRAAALLLATLFAASTARADCVEGDSPCCIIPKATLLLGTLRTSEELPDVDAGASDGEFLLVVERVGGFQPSRAVGDVVKVSPPFPGEGLRTGLRAVVWEHIGGECLRTPERFAPALCKPKYFVFETIDQGRIECKLNVVDDRVTLTEAEAVDLAFDPLGCYERLKTRLGLAGQDLCEGRERVGCDACTTAAPERSAPGATLSLALSGAFATLGLLRLRSRRKRGA